MRRQANSQLHHPMAKLADLLHQLGNAAEIYLALSDACLKPVFLVLDDYVKLASRIFLKPTTAIDINSNNPGKAASKWCWPHGSAPQQGATGRRAFALSLCGSAW